jgi:hypothetical protein
MHIRGPPRVPIGRMAVTRSDGSSKSAEQSNGRRYPALLFSVVNLAPRSAGGCVTILGVGKKQGVAHT